MKKNIKFILKCILALAPALVLVIFTALCPMCYMDEEYPAWRYTQNVVNGRTSGGDMIILGDSRAMADLIPEYFGDDCINLAVGGGTPIEMYYFYRRYIRNNPAPDKAIVMFAPFHYSYIDNYKTRTTYFNALTFSEQRELYSNAVKCGADAVAFEDAVEYGISSRLRLPNVYLPAIMNARGIGRYSSNSVKYDSIVNTRGQGYFGMEDGCDGVASEAGYTEMGSGGNRMLIDMYFRMLLKELNVSGVTVVLEQPPVNSATYELLNDAYIQEYAAYISDCCRAYDNVIYSTDIPEYANEYFGDPSHLNEKGANRFSEEFHTKYADLL